MPVKTHALAALLAAAFPAFCSAQTFDGLPSGAAQIKAQPSAAPAPSAAKPAAAGAEAYEELVQAPVWKTPAQAAAPSDLRDGFAAARYQGNRNVCNAFAASALAEYLVRGRDGGAPDFSEEFLYYDTKLKFTDAPELQAYRSEPGLPGYAAVLALRGGVVNESDWPFLAALPQHAPVPPLTDPDIGVPPAGVEQKVLGYSFEPQAVRRADIKYFLATERRPVVMNLMLYFGNIDNATGRLKQPTEAQRRQCLSAGDNCGGHVVLLTGYDPKTGEYMFRNSWGPGWGDKGYGRVPEAYVEQDCESCGHLPALAGFGLPTRRMVVNAAYGWSAALK